MTTTTNNNEQYLLNEQVAFEQHSLPGLDAGEYQLQVEQRVFEHDGITPVSGDAYSNTYTFAVAGDRFSLSNGAAVVDTVFPADNASGEYSAVLPHVVFSKTTFPWTRYPTINEPYKPPQPGKDVDSDVPTWLWVMLLDQDDVAANPGLLTIAQNATIGDLFPVAAFPGSTLGAGNNSYFNDATDLSALEPGQNTSDAIQIIDLPLDLFQSLAPSLADLNLLSHVRTVSLINQPANSMNIIGEPTGSFSIVFGNRLPASQKKTYAYLMSLEGMENFLPPTGGLPPNGPVNPSILIRLAVLKTWTFFSTGDTAGFVHTLESLNGCTPGGPPASNTNIRLDYNGSNAVVKAALDMGYVPLNETMRTAEQNVSWYRGPLVPYSTTVNNNGPMVSPDAAMIFDPTTGMLDVSLSAAWTIGRLVALQDVAFSTGLYNWKRGLDQQAYKQIENDLIAETFSNSFKGVMAEETPSHAGSLFKQIVMANKNHSDE